MNSKWQIYRVGLVDFWYYDEEEFYFLDGRMLLRGANGSGKSVTMQSFIPLLLDGNMRPERLDPFGSRARKMENYLLEEGDGREERTGYLYMELKREESEEYLTLGIGMRARRNKKMDSWYFCITDGRRIGTDLQLYKDVQNKVTCTMRELKNRIGEGGKVMETQSEYAQCVNRLLFGFETQEEYKELLDLLIQLRTPKLSKDFKPSVINEILSCSLQTLSEDDLRPMSEAIENMDSLKTNLDNLMDSIQAARQIEKVYDKYNEIVLYDKALLYTDVMKKYADSEKKAAEIEKGILEGRDSKEAEEQHYQTLMQEEKVLQAEKESLSDSDATRLKNQEINIRQQLKELEGAISQKERQKEEKNEKRLETEEIIRIQKDKNEIKWQEIEEKLEEMEEEIGEIPFDDFTFLKGELLEKGEEEYSFTSHEQLLKDYTQKVEAGKEALLEEKNIQERYSRFLKELDELQEEKDHTERELLQYGNQLHEIKQELIEQLYKWARGNEELHPEESVLQEMSRRIEGYHTDTDYWEIKNLAKGAFDQKHEELFAKKNHQRLELEEKQKEFARVKEELNTWKSQREPEPDRSEAVIRNRQILEEKGIPYQLFYKMVDFDKGLNETQMAVLEEALLRMGLLDALIIPAEYREKVLALDGEICDNYLFTDVSYVKENLMNLLDIEEGENNLLVYQNVSKILSAVGCKSGAGCENSGGTWIDENGNFGMGILEGTITKNYQPCFIGAFAREQYRLRKIAELEGILEQQETEIEEQKQLLEQVENRMKKLEEEWRSFPGEQDLKIAARDYERLEEKLTVINGKIQAQKELLESERKKLDEIRMKVQELCRKCYLTARLDLFMEVLESLKAYRELLTALQLCHGSYVNGMQNLRAKEEYLEEIESDLDDIRYDLGRVINQKREQEATLSSVLEQLKLTDYEKIRERLDHCTKRLTALPMEREASVKKQTNLQNEVELLMEKQQENERQRQQLKGRKETLKRAFQMEYDLGYVERFFVITEDMEDQAKKICAQMAGKFGNKKQSDLFGSLQEEYHKNRGNLLDYQITLKTLFEELDEESSFTEMSMKRIDISAKYRGVTVKFKELLRAMEEDKEMQTRLLSDKDRELFEDILTNTISKKIRARIQASKRWVEKMNRLMESMQTSSGLTLSLRWKNKRAEKEEQLDTKDLVELLQKDAEIMRPEEAAQLSAHFRSKIEEARKTAGEAANVQSFHSIMREILDYRQWFVFQLECQKTGEKKKELTDRVFFTFSGGEKAMSMYVPLFSAVVAKYAGARQDAPKLISLDEAFAGVDEMNIRDMFRLMVEFGFNFMINSQILWGDYDTVPGLAIYQLIRPENAKYVTVIRYVWTGTARRMVTEKNINEG